jgi:hypothetical protein
VGGVGICVVIAIVDGDVHVDDVTEVIGEGDGDEEGGRGVDNTDPSNASVALGSETSVTEPVLKVSSPVSKASAVSELVVEKPSVGVKVAACKNAGTQSRSPG